MVYYIETKHIMRNTLLTEVVAGRKSCENAIFSLGKMEVRSYGTL